MFTCMYTNHCLGWAIVHPSDSPRKMAVTFAGLNLQGLPSLSLLMYQLAHQFVPAGNGTR